ncbi:MAG: hypothetical protein WBM04_14535 [Candidatus Korobacteraceae bacterium]
MSSIGAHYLPFPRPSVSSMGPVGNTYAYRHHQPYSNRLYRGHGFSGTGWAYASPYYYIPLGDYGYGYDYDYVGGPDMYSGPPISPNDPSLHMIVEQPPTQSYRRAPPDDVQAVVTPPPQITPEQPPAEREAKPREPTVLVFRDGHQQEVSNYAIMGQTVYVLDDRIQKIPLTNLDVSATVKANDDRGMEFKVPVTQGAAQKKNLDLQPNGTPQQTPNPGTSVASVLP